MKHVVIVGGGFSGALLAANLIRHGGPRVTLIERRGEPGRGTAYSTVHVDHLLNVRAANMSAFPDDPDHFVRWLAGHAGREASGFVPRKVYGDYLEALLGAAVAAADGRLAIRADDVIDIETVAGTQRVRFADGGEIAADVVVLAVGNLPPTAPPGLDAARLEDGRYIGDPWHGDLRGGLGRDDTVLILGTGLTMIDVALSLEADGFSGRIVALSRHGLLPHPHREGTTPTSRSERPPPEPSALLHAMRRRAREIPWRSAVDELRPYTQGLWRAMSLAERSRFLRHLRPWWDVHRHRIAPVIAERLAGMQRDGRLETIAGHFEGVEPVPGGLVVHLRRRGSAGRESIEVARFINATGPQGDLARTREPLLQALAGRGVLRPDPLAIGVDVDQDSRAIDRDGVASDALFVVGPMTRGAFWEIVAVPDIRRQAWAIARRICNAHWVEGEGL